ncbi:MAG: hypothetical protein HUU16_00935 [Candidatus Omnitrophica bacterium]|nr:hypothetical protein [Candidatus Omnitrophota bacterium]
MELARHNRVCQRSIPIPLFSEGGLKDLLEQGEIILAAPDPESPPSRESFDALLGYVFAGGKVTLVDGVEGFRGRKGWWTEAGATDPADYAIRLFGIPVDPGSRQTLDEEGLSPEVNTFALGFTPLTSGEAKGIERVSVPLPERGGVLLLHPRRENGPGMRLHSVRFGKTGFHPLSLEAEPMVAGERGGRMAFSSIGEPMAWELLGESYVAYRVPEGATSGCELEVEGEWAVAWGKAPPVETHTLRKKAFQSWFQKELLTVEIPRVAHPTVYSGTYTCRVFDVTGTQVSPVWFQKIGKGSFAWVGLPLDWVLRGSDTGADGQNPLRNDPGFDLIRLTLALHDSRRAGGGRASREPLSGWGSKWSASLPGDPRVDLAYHAFFPMERLNPWRSIGGGWPFDRAMDAIEHAKSSGMILSGSPVAVALDRNGQERVDLYANCCLHALLHRIEEIAAREGQGALQAHAARERKRLLASLVEILEVTAEQPVPARFLLNDAPASAASIAETLPAIAWAVSEIPPQDYPGGASARARLLSLLLSEQAALSDSRSLAALAAVSEERRAELVERILSRAGAGDLALIGHQEESFDLASAIPGLHALCLSKRRS